MPRMPFSHVTKAQLDNGKIVTYQFCCSLDSFSSGDPENFEFLGTGIIIKKKTMEVYYVLVYV
jgi:hypothetical protein